MELSEIIGVDAVRAPLKATSKKRLLQDLADMAEAVYGLPSATVYKALMDREALGPTGVGRGVAIPHARFAGVSHVLGLFVRLEKPVDFESIDRQPVDLVFALFAPGGGRGGSPEGAGAGVADAAQRGGLRQAALDLRPLGALRDPDRRQGRAGRLTATRPARPDFRLQAAVRSVHVSALEQSGMTLTVTAVQPRRARPLAAAAVSLSVTARRKSRNSSRRSGRARPKATVACR